MPYTYEVALPNSCLHSWYLDNTSTTSNSTSSSRRTRHLSHRPSDRSNNAKASKSKSATSNNTGESCGTASGLLIVIRLHTVIPSHVQIAIQSHLRWARATEPAGTNRSSLSNLTKHR